MWLLFTGIRLSTVNLNPSVSFWNDLRDAYSYLYLDVVISRRYSLKWTSFERKMILKKKKEEKILNFYIITTNILIFYKKKGID